MFNNVEYSLVYMSRWWKLRTDIDEKVSKKDSVKIKIGVNSQNCLKTPEKPIENNNNYKIMK